MPHCLEFLHAKIVKSSSLAKSSIIGLKIVRGATGIPLLSMQVARVPPLYACQYLHQVFSSLGQNLRRYAESVPSEQWYNTAPIAFFISWMLLL